MSITNNANAVCFYNNGEFDKRAFTMLGLSAKQTDNPIGFFGTGFKYAIATLLRHGYKVRIYTDDCVYNFHTAPSVFRDKEYTSIYCSYGEDDEDYIELPFTTHLGANWKLWQAYRELYTNARDEQGSVSLAHADSVDRTYSVCVLITGDNIAEFIKIYNAHDKYFINPLAPVVCEGARMRCLERKPDSDNVVYYKTMYTGTRLDKKSYFTYDYVDTQELTEDRTLAHAWMLREHIGTLWATSMSYDMLITHLPKVATSEYYEHNLEIGYQPPSEAFFAACAYLNEHHLSMPLWARDLYTKQLPFAQQITAYKPTRHQQALIRRAVSILHHHRCMIDTDKMTMCVSLPDEILGYYKDDHIYISKLVFDHGFEKLLGTMYEEYIHQHENVGDYTNRMQNFLVDRCASLMLQVYEMDTTE